MSTPIVTASQIRAARHLANLSQDDISKATKLSLPTIRRAESERDVSVSPDAVAAIRAALEKAGVIFVEENGEGPGVRLRKQAQSATSERQSDAALDLAIIDHENAIAAMPEHPEPSPEAALVKMDKALAENDLVALKNKRARRKNLK